MQPEEIRDLRKVLSCTAKELAAALSSPLLSSPPLSSPHLDVDQATVLAWEKGELFPTKQHVDRMKELEAKGPSAIPRLAKGKAKANVSPIAAMRDPAFWEIVRKIAAHKTLRDEVAKLAAGYPEPD